MKKDKDLPAINKMITKCLCGSQPIIERKPITGNFALLEEVVKYKCLNCKDKELPWLGQFRNNGALQEWNRIAPERSYHKRTLDYNEYGVCISEPFKLLEWKNKNKPH
jgi:hypothetical protein